MRSELQIRNIQNNKLENLLGAADYLYKFGLVPKGKEKKLEQVINILKDAVGKEF